MKPVDTPNEQNVMTAGAMARILNRSTLGVMNALKRLNIGPDLVLGRISYYPKSAVETLRAEMRTYSPRK